MKFKAIKFNKDDRPEFFNELRLRVNKYFEENNIPSTANVNMKIKTVFLLLLYLVPLGVLIFGTVSNFWTMILMWVLMGFGFSGVGLSIMHDANHGAYSKNKRVNNALSLMLNLAGGYHINWRIQHNVLHHSFTNILGYDEDIEKSIIRMSPDQKYKQYHRFQVLYAPILYSIMTFYWIVSKDFEQLFRYDKKGLLKSQGKTFSKALIEILVTKILYFLVVLIIPMMVLPFAWWQVFIGFLVMHIIGGLTLALIFQTAHVNENTDFYIPNKEGDSIDNSWAIHQILTTTNFAHRSSIFSWYIGGLNYQIEHHLFPGICHVHYKKLSPIVKQTAEEYNLPYYQKKTFAGAVISHFKLLYRLGLNKN
ncbi:MAG: acyl-CoA desaturase [Bacteroidetes bacterium]|nr:acyl-CoA desaturase [Bacteroidota bacterium]